MGDRCRKGRKGDGDGRMGRKRLEGWLLVVRAGLHIFFGSLLLFLSESQSIGFLWRKGSTEAKPSGLNNQLMVGFLRGD